MLDIEEFDLQVVGNRMLPDFFISVEMLEVMYFHHMHWFHYSMCSIIY